MPLLLLTHFLRQLSAPRRRLLDETCAVSLSLSFSPSPTFLSVLQGQVRNLAPPPPSLPSSSGYPGLDLGARLRRFSLEVVYLRITNVYYYTCDFQWYVGSWYKRYFRRGDGRTEECPSSLGSASDDVGVVGVPFVVVDAATGETARH